MDEVGLIITHIDGSGQLRFATVGGIDENNMSEYLRAGVCGFGIGSNIVDKKLVEAGDFAAITELAKKYTSVIAKAVRT